MTLQHWLDRADELCGEGRYFEAHEELEAGWKGAAEPEKTLLQGVIQLAAGLHRLRLAGERREGAVYLLERGLEKLRREAALLDPASLAALELVVAELLSGARPAPAALRLGLRAKNS